MSGLPIGSFQMENLVKNKVPFFLFAEPVTWSEIYQGEDLKQIEKALIEIQPFAPQKILEAAENKKLAKDAPIVVLAAKSSAKAEADALSASGFMNVYYVLDGFQGLTDF